MLCPHCSGWVADNVRACTFCGHTLPATGAEAAYPAMSVQNVTLGYAPVTTCDRDAGFWLRLAAWVIDNLILWLVGFVAGFMFGVVYGQMGGSSDHLEIIGGAIGLLIGWLYFACFESSTAQATPGKLVLGVMVSDVYGRRISFGRATGRYFAKFISALILLVGFIMAGFTRRKQALHDLMAECLVVRRS